MADIVLRQPDLCLSFAVALLQYVHELQQLSLHVLLTDKLLMSLRTMSLWTLVQSGDTELTLQSLVSLSPLVWSGGANRNLQTLKVLQMLKEGYTLPIQTRPNLTRSPTIISCYINPHRKIYLTEALHQLMNKNVAEKNVVLVKNQESRGFYNGLFWSQNQTTGGGLY